MVFRASATRIVIANASATGRASGPRTEVAITINTGRNMRETKTIIRIRNGINTITSGVETGQKARVKKQLQIRMRIGFRCAVRIINLNTVKLYLQTCHS